MTNQTRTVVIVAVLVLLVALLTAAFLGGGIPRFDGTTPTAPPVSARAATTPATTTPAATTAPPATSTPSATPASRVFRSDTGRWSASIPVAWFSEESAGRAIIRSYDPSQAAFERAPGAAESGPDVPTSEVRIVVAVTATGGALTAKEAADNHLNAPDPSRSQFTLVSRRDDLVIAGQTATLLLEATNLPPRPSQVRRVYFLLTPSPAQLITIRAWPDNTTRSAQLDAFIRTFTVN